jgi:hypothetical protein
MPPKNLPTSTVKKPGKKRHNQIPKTKKRAVVPRYVQFMIRLSTDDFLRGLPYFQDRENLKRFTLEAVREKINRAEANDKAARMKKLVTNMDELADVLREMAKSGKLGFLMEACRNVQ